MIDFRDVLELCGLGDLGFAGLPYTFDNRRSGRANVKVRLDRALATPSWSSMFPFASLEHLTAAKSDHCPILLSNELEQNAVRYKLKKPFRYEVIWETDGRFSGALEDMWRSDGPAMLGSAMADKLSAMANTLRRWGRNTFGSIRQELRALRLII